MAIDGPAGAGKSTLTLRLAFAIVGEGMRGTPGLAGWIFMAVSRQNVNRGSQRWAGVHAECRLGYPADPSSSTLIFQ